MKNYLDHLTWKNISVCGYQVSSEGFVRSIDRKIIHTNGKVYNLKGKLLAPSLSNSGYLFVSLTNKHLKFYIHRLVAETFIGRISKGREVNHKDGDKKNNSVDNLEIVTSSENKKHAYKCLGFKSWNIALNAEQVAEIMRIKKIGKISQAEISRRYNVSPMTISRLVRNIQKCYEQK